MSKTDNNINSAPHTSHSREGGNLGCPRNWTPTNLGAVIELKYGKSLTARTRDGGEYPVFGSNGVVGGHSIPLVNSTGIIVGRKGSYGEVQFSEKPFYPIDTTYFIDEFFQQPQKYWFHQLKLLPLTTLNRSTAIPGINREDAYAQPIFLPPLAEQKVIADKLDELLAQVDTLKARLDAIPAILKRFRQSVLAAAVSGKLTEEWRKLTPDAPKDEFDTELVAAQPYKKKSEVTVSHDIVTKSLPEAWNITTFGELYKFIDYRGKTPKKSLTGKRLYTAKNIKMGCLSNEPVEYLSAIDYAKWMTRGFTKKGDLFFVTEGHTMGCCAINTVGADIALAQRTLTLQPVGNVNSQFHFYYILSDAFQRLVQLNATGTAAKGIKAAKFRSLPAPFPSIREQTEIVRRVEQLFTYADQVEQQVKNAQVRVNQLTQSILAKAFRGELTEQWRQDNPELISGDNSAAALLQRIKAERAAAAPPRKAKKQQTKVKL